MNIAKVRVESHATNDAHRAPDPDHDSPPTRATPTYIE